MKHLCFVVLAGTLLALAQSLCAQDYDSTQQRLLTGTVLVEPGAPPPGRAIVVLYTSLNILVAQTSTNSSGSFTFPDVGAGNYRVVVRLAGYQEGAADVSIYRGSTHTRIMPIVLKSTPGAPPQPSQGTVDAAELSLSKEASRHYSKARQALDKGKLEEARDHLQRTIQSAPGFAPAHSLLGIAENLQGNYTKAEAAFRQAIQRDPRRADPYFGLGKTLNSLNRPGDALAIIEKGLELSPKSPLGLFEKSRSHFSLRDYPAAERTALQALGQPSPPPSEVHLILANCYLNLRRYPDAATELELYLRLEPKSTSAAKAQEILSKLKAAGITPRAGVSQK